MGSLHDVGVSSLSVYFTGFTSGQFYRDFLFGEIYHQTDTIGFIVILSRARAICVSISY